MHDLHTPILFIIFNRPDTTEKVFQRIREARPKQLFIAADGPRANRPDDAEKCRQTRAIVEHIDWPCEVKKLYREQNMGCRAAVSGAISWYFEQVEMGMILEDDCLPEASFFGYCQEVLERYKDDKRVMHVNGSNFLLGWVNDPDYSYYFSKGNSIWGWASWRRAWQYYDVNIPLWPEVKRKKLHYSFSQIRMDVLNREEAFDKVYERRLDTWDFQWSFTINSQHGLSIIPNRNLISNIGFGGEATHTTTANKRADLPTLPIDLPLKHPPYMIADWRSDKKLIELHAKRGISWKIKNWRKLFFV